MGASFPRLVRQICDPGVRHFTSYVRQIFDREVRQNPIIVVKFLTEGCVKIPSLSVKILTEGCVMVRHLAMENNTQFCTLDTRTASEITVSAFPRQVKIKVGKRFGIRGKNACQNLASKEFKSHPFSLHFPSNKPMKSCILNLKPGTVQRCNNLVQSFLSKRQQKNYLPHAIFCSRDSRPAGQTRARRC